MALLLQELGPLSHILLTSRTGTIFSYGPISLLNNPSIQGTDSTEVDNHEEQLRLFKNGVELARPTPDGPGGDYTINQTTEQITLTVALVITDELLILRQTRQDRPYVQWTDSARLKSTPDMNLSLDQMFGIVQDISEWGEVAEILDNITYPDIRDTSSYSQTHTNTTATDLSYSTVTLLRNDRVLHEDQLLVTLNGVEQILTVDYTVDVANLEVDLVTPPISSDTIVITRTTPRVRVITSLPNASSFSSDTVQLVFDQLRHLIEELAFWVGLDEHTITNLRRPRRRTLVRYSGPGDKFFYGNLPFDRDGTVFVWRDDTLLIEGTDYLIDPFLFFIQLLADLGSNVLTIQTVGGCPTLFCNTIYNFGNRQETKDSIDTGEGQTQQTLAVPTILVPVTSDQDTEDPATALNIKVDLDVAEARLLWNLSTFQGRIATTSTFGLTFDTAPAGGDVFHIFRATGTTNAAEGTWTVLDPTNPIVWTSPSGAPWAITPSILTFVNDALQEEGELRIVIRAANAGSFLEAHSREGQAANDQNFAPHLSLEGATYPGQATDTDEDITEDTQMLDPPSDDTNFVNTDPLGLQPTLQGHSCFQFDLSAITLTNFATAHLVLVSAVDDISTFSPVMRIRRCLQTWNLTQLTWNIFSTGNSWGSPGALDRGVDFDAGTETTYTFVNPYSIGTPMVSPDIMPLLTAAKADDDILRLIVIGPIDIPFIGVNVFSQENATPSNRPILRLLT